MHPSSGPDRTGPASARTWLTKGVPRECQFGAAHRACDKRWLRQVPLVELRNAAGSISTFLMIGERHQPHVLPVRQSRDCQLDPFSFLVVLFLATTTPGGLLLCLVVLQRNPAAMRGPVADAGGRRRHGASGAGARIPGQFVALEVPAAACVVCDRTGSARPGRDLSPIDQKRHGSSDVYVGARAVGGVLSPSSSRQLTSHDCNGHRRASLKAPAGNRLQTRLCRL